MNGKQISNKQKKQRIALVDVVRGTALLLMFSFHFSFDLNYFGFIHTDFYRNQFWLNFRSVIVSLFLVVVGVSLFLAHANRINWQSIRKRSLQLGLAAIAVTIGSYVLFPKSYIYFGVLHFILLATFLGLPFLRIPVVGLVVGIGVIWFGTEFSSPIFDQPWLNWVGLMTHKPITEDYVPVMPWMGVVLIGIFLGSLLKRANSRWVVWQAQRPPLSVVAMGGRHSLMLYLLHQPLFILLLYGVVQLT